MKVSIVINIINAILDYVFIFGFWLIPEMGIAGAALATVVARVVGSLALFYYIKHSDVLSFRSDFWKPDREHLWELITLGGPAAGERLIMRVGQIRSEERRVGKEWRTEW